MSAHPSPEKPPHISDSPPIGRFTWRHEVFPGHEIDAVEAQTAGRLKPFQQASCVYLSPGTVFPHIVELGNGLGDDEAIAHAYVLAEPDQVHNDPRALRRGMLYTVTRVIAKPERQDRREAVYRLLAELGGNEAILTRDQRLRVREVFAGIMRTDEDREKPPTLTLGNLILFSPDQAEADHVAALAGDLIMTRRVKVGPVTSLARKKSR